MSELDLVLLTFVRALSFAALLFFVSRRLIPLSVRAACACTLVIFSLAGRSADLTSAWILAANPSASSTLTWQTILSELAAGICLAVILAAPVLVMVCAAAWLRSFFLPTLSRDELQWGGERTISLVLTLWFFVAVLDLPGLREIFVLFAAGLNAGGAHAAADPAAFDASVLGDSLAFVGKTAFQLSLLIAGPLMLAGLALDAVLFVSGRYFRELSAKHTVYAVKIPFLALLFLISLYPLSGQLKGQSDKLATWGHERLGAGQLP